MWGLANYDVGNYEVLKKYSVFNYYIYVENLEAEKQRQSKMNKKGIGNTKGKNKI
jgi:hypothetical protein